ncbi:hypothetical protein Esti_006424 [Eimeria stiedai]
MSSFFFVFFACILDCSRGAAAAVTAEEHELQGLTIERPLSEAQDLAEKPDASLPAKRMQISSQRARGLGAPGGPLASDFLRALWGTQRHKPWTGEAGAPPGEEALSESRIQGPPHGGPLWAPKRSAQYPNFRSRVCFHHPGEKASFFPPHMAKGIVQLQKKLPQVDCLVEVRDARAPLTSSGCVAALKPPQGLQRLIVLNKCDLVSPSDAKVTSGQEQGVALGFMCVLTSAKALKGVQRITNWLLQLPTPKFACIGRWMLLAGLPNTGKSSVLNALKRLAYSASYYGREGNQLVTGVKRTPAKTGKLPGVTKELQAFQVTNKPRVYCIDSPGILLPKQCDEESSLRLAVLGILPERLAGEERVADFLLFHLNRHHHFDYVEALGLSEPTNDIREISRHICLTLGRKAERFSLPPIDLTKGYQFFLSLFREGHLGSLCLDALPEPQDLQRRTDLLHLQREPPDPWTPGGQEDVIPGLS